MLIFEWNPLLHSVKVELFDNQHRKIIDLLNVFHQHLIEGKGKKIINAIIDELEQYAMEHFTAEESLMQKHQFPLFDEHKKEHAYFKSKLVDFRIHLYDTNSEVTINTYVFLKNWLITHILNTDKKYSGFLNDKGIK